MRDIPIGHLPLMILLCLLIAAPFSGASLSEDQVPPSISSIVEGDGYILLEWTVPEEADVENITFFHIWRKDLPSPFGPVRSDIFQYNDTSVENGIEYSYSISAEYRNQSLKAESELIYASPGVPPGTPTVTGLFQVNRSVSIRVELSEIDGGFPVEGVLIQRKNNSENFTTIKILNSTVDRYLDASVIYNVEYSYRVISVNEKGPSTPSEIRTITLKSPPKAPDNIQDLETSNDTATISISWKAPFDDGGSDILGYRIMRSVGDSGFSEVKIVENGILEFIDLDVSANINYTYTVTAFNQYGEAYDPPSIRNRIIIPVHVEETDDDDDQEDDHLVRNAILIGGLIGIVIIAVSIFIYLRLTEEVDEREMEP